MLGGGGESCWKRPPTPPAPWQPGRHQGGVKGPWRRTSAGFLQELIRLECFVPVCWSCLLVQQISPCLEHCITLLTELSHKSTIFVAPLTARTQELLKLHWLRWDPRVTWSGFTTAGLWFYLPAGREVSDMPSGPPVLTVSVQCAGSKGTGNSAANIIKYFCLLCLFSKWGRCPGSAHSLGSFPLLQVLLGSDGAVDSRR